jgi:hypothetical protein
MNQLYSYEESMAKKMSQLSVPDRKLEIWDAVQLQLMADIESIPNAKPISSTKIKTGISELFIGISIFVIVATSILIAPKVKEVIPSKENIPSTSVPEKKEELNLSKKTNEQTQKSQAKSPTNKLLPVQVQTSQKLESDIQSVPFEFKKAFNPDNADLILRNKLSRDSAKKLISIPPVKKNMGVFGISDSSYRISARKDSL